MTEHLVVKIQKWVIWGVLAYVVYLMHSLFTVVFLTFILSYIGNSAVSFLTRRFQYRRFNLTLIYFVFISLLLAFASVVIPRVFSEALDLAQHQIVESQSDTMPQVPVAMHGPLADGDTQARAASPVLTRETKKYLDRAIIQIMGRDYFQTFRKSSAYDDLVVKVEDYITAFIPRIVDGVKGFVNNLLKVAFHFLLSIIFSFLIIWDLPRLSESVRSFGQGRTAEAYAEISPGLRAFGVMLGKAFEALVERLRARRPEVYDEEAHYCLDWLMPNALVARRYERVPALAGEMANARSVPSPWRTRSLRRAA